VETIAAERRISIASREIAGGGKCRAFSFFGPEPTALLLIAPSRFNLIASTVGRATTPCRLPAASGACLQTNCSRLLADCNGH
jgi:hypothetical protein